MSENEKKPEAQRDYDDGFHHGAELCRLVLEHAVCVAGKLRRDGKKHYMLKDVFQETTGVPVNGLIGDNLWVSEYNPKGDGSFHVQLLIETLRRNMEIAIAKESSDWILLGVFKTPEEAQADCDQFKMDLKARQ
jgi:hypothetical protein